MITAIREDEAQKNVPLLLTLDTSTAIKKGEEHGAVFNKIRLHIARPFLAHSRLDAYVNGDIETLCQIQAVDKTIERVAAEWKELLYPEGHPLFVIEVFRSQKMKL